MKAAGPTARKAPDIGKYFNITGFQVINPVISMYLPMSGAFLAVGPAASSGTKLMKFVNAEGIRLKVLHLHCCLSQWADYCTGRVIRLQNAQHLPHTT